MRQQGELDLTGDGEFALDGCLLGGGGLELFDILGERVLHVAEGVAQLTNLIVALHFGQGTLEVSLCHLVGALSQQLERLRRAVYGDTADPIGNQQPQNDDRQDDQSCDER